MGIEAGIVAEQRRAIGADDFVRVAPCVWSNGGVSPTHTRQRSQRSRGDAANVILSAVGYNLRLVLAWLRIILPVILLALLQTFTIRPALKPTSNGRFPFPP